MASASVIALVDRVVRANHEVVTYRAVARDLKISARDAQNELQAYIDASQGAVWATFVVTGDDSNGGRRILLVPQDSLDATKAQFETVASIQVYSLSPASDASFISLAAQRVRASEAKTKTATLRPANAAPVTKKPAPAAKPTEEQKAKPRGVLDFSKAKPKAAPAPAPAPAKPAPAPAPAKKAEAKPPAAMAQPAQAKVKTEPTAEPKKVQPQPSTSRLPKEEEEEEEEEEEKPVVASRKRKMVIDDEEEEEEEAPSKPAARGKPAQRRIQASDDEMDVDETESEPVDIYEDMEPDVKAKRKKGKGGVPMGSNGRPKKRVMKERTITDKKGFEGIEDYSEYETDNDPPEAEKPKATKAKKTAAAPKPKPEAKKTSAKPGQQKMTNFFGKNKK
ncbi:hypothetical protein EXIGLDRAFT_766894 [Exidia glandulosa HHB12029]|uniref:DNA polymerase delta subunit 3 n=1 Tax=Exidia glandulosa HHB12029 TaxID=1314781 RepID=A0A165JEP0_EXIGL|nr:hypothetical protein EXIGLDRAFT_766894 [Exidia glandulosa HHB12029]